MKIKVTPIRRYSISIDGEEKGEFTKVETWEGMAKFTNKEGIIIADEGTPALSSMFKSLVGDDAPIEMTVVKISPGLTSD